MAAKINLVGERFGRLLVIRRIKLGDAKGRWLCKCDCGSEKVILTCSLRSGKTRSCGCLRKEITSQRFSKHGDHQDRLYGIWTGMKNRCRNESNPSYKNYGERGILVCSEWDHYAAFKEWATSNGYRENLTIERIDCNGNYEPLNCTWIERKFQARNTTQTTRYAINGDKRPLVEWCELFSVPLNRAHHRIYSGKQPFSVGEIYQALKGDK